MVGEMRLFSNNGLKKDWKTVIAVKLRQRQCKEGWGSLSPAIRLCFEGNCFKVFFNSFETFWWIFHVSLSCHAREKHISKVQMSTHWPWQDLDVWMSEQWTGLGLISPPWKVATPLAQLTNHLNKSLLTDLRVPGRLGTREKRFIGHELKNLL